MRKPDHLVREVDGVLGFRRVTERPQRLAEQRLQIHLSRIDDVEDARGVAERRRARIPVVRRRGPERPAVSLRREQAIAKVEPEQPELPELVREILADVCHDAVRADDHFLARLVIVGGGLNVVATLG